MPRSRRNFSYLARSQLGSETVGKDGDGEGEDNEEDLVAEALEEHQEVKTLITALHALDPNDEQFQIKFTELRDCVEEHVSMEEDEVMSDTMASLGDKIAQLGRQLEEPKEQLMAGKSSQDDVDSA
jgi:hypothetical protein